jgi:hypothetical protein
MSDGNVISFTEYVKKMKGQKLLDKQYFEALGEDIKTRPELIMWYNFQNQFNKHKLFLHALYTSNHRDDNPNPNAGYFVTFSEEQLQDCINKIIEANEWLERSIVLIDAKDCTFAAMAKQLFGTEPNSRLDAWKMFEEVLLGSNKVIVLSNISKSKIASRKSGFARMIIKINDDAHIKKIKPKSDILFVDSAGFLERSWDELGDYINIFT